MLAILTMWLGISFPLVCIGFYFGYRKHVNIEKEEEGEMSICLFLAI
jgi:hypothetical protein